MKKVIILIDSCEHIENYANQNFRKYDLYSCVPTGKMKCVGSANIEAKKQNYIAVTEPTYIAIFKIK